ncbi:MAG: glycoside hydrolase family 18 protein [Chloroflexota bacterium]
MTNRPFRHASPMLAAIVVLLPILAACGASTAPSSRVSAAPASSLAASPASASGGSGGSAGGGSVDPAGSPLAPSPSASSPAPSGSPSGSPAPSDPGSSPGSTTAGYDPQKFGFEAKGMSHEMMAFVTTSQIDYALNAMDFDVVSTVAFFSLEVNSAGHISHDGRWRIWNEDRVTRLISMAHDHGSKVVISLARFAWSPGQTKVSRASLSSAAKRAALAKEVAAEVARRGVDGVNVDYEPIPVGQKANFTNFVRLLRAELDAIAPGYQLTFDVTGHHESYDIGAALKPGGADAVYLMGYHYAGTWSKVAASTSPLGGPRYDLGDTIASILRVAKPKQLIVGVPYYGHTWPTKTAAIHSRTVGGGHDVTYVNAIAATKRLGGKFDPVEQVHWVAFKEGGQWYQMYFDDARAMAAKWQLIKNRKLLGSGVWTIGFEGGKGALDAAMRSAFLVSEATQ